MGKTLVKADGKVNVELCKLRNGVDLILYCRPSPLSTKNANAAFWWSAIHVKLSGLSCTDASTRRVSRRKLQRSEPAALWNTTEQSSVPPWQISMPRETWSPRSARLNVSRQSSELSTYSFCWTVFECNFCIFRAAKEQKKAKTADKKAKTAPSKQGKSKPAQKQQKAAPRVGGKR